MLAPLLQSRKQRIDALERFCCRGLRNPEGAELQIVLDVHGAEQFAVLGHQTQARRDAILDVERGHVQACEGGGALERQHAHDGVQQRGLAGAVGADDGDDLVVGDLERHRAHRLDLAVGDMDVTDLQERAHVAAPR